MKITSKKLFQHELGNSKISLHQIDGVDKYVIAVQDSDSSDIMLQLSTDGQIKILDSGATDIRNVVLVEKIESEQLTRLADKILKHIPTEKK